LPPGCRHRRCGSLEARAAPGGKWPVPTSARSAGSEPRAGIPAVCSICSSAAAAGARVETRALENEPSRARCLGGAEEVPASLAPRSVVCLADPSGEIGNEVDHDVGLRFWLCAALAEPSDGLEPSTPSLPCDVCGERSLTGANVSACSRPFNGLRRAVRCARCPLVFPKSFHRSARCDRLCSSAIGPKRAV